MSHDEASQTRMIQHFVLDGVPERVLTIVIKDLIGQLWLVMLACKTKPVGCCFTFQKL
jgi:hypothetical protein